MLTTLAIYWASFWYDFAQQKTPPITSYSLLYARTGVNRLGVVERVWSVIMLLRSKSHILMGTICVDTLARGGMGVVYLVGSLAEYVVGLQVSMCYPYSDQRK